jgi:hypothetical protein
MFRRHYVLALMLAVIVSLVFAPRALNGIRASEKQTSQGKAIKPTDDAHTITVLPWGPSQENVEASKADLLRSPALLRYLKATRFRLISFDFIDKGKINGSITPPDVYRAIFFDYTHNRAYAASGRFDSSGVEVAPYYVQPLPSEEEFNAAVEILSRDPRFGVGIANGTLTAYRPMPPLINDSLPVGQAHRTVTVGFQSSDPKQPPEILGVDMISETIVRFANNAPQSAVASPDAVCGPPSGGGGSSSSGQYNLIITRGGVEVWNLVVVTPSSSLGTRGSGIEVRNVNYHGQRVLTRGHVPILNVEYERNTCGPYRDWTYSQNNFTANGSDVVPGIRICTSNPQTILESGIDAGNFSGVAIFDNREEVRLVTEMDAGWYRYLMEWNFADDGRIRPRFGFGTTANSCVCNTHNHHCYWRLDFDIVSAAGNLVTENSPGGSTEIKTESMRPRLYGTNQTWTITTAASATASCTIMPGPNDGNYDKYGKGDFWVLINKDVAGCGNPVNCQYDDGVNCTTCLTSYIQIDPFINGESTSNADVVVWYGTHYNHHDAGNGPTGLIGDHVVGPDIVLRGY